MKVTFAKHVRLFDIKNIDLQINKIYLGIFMDANIQVYIHIYRVISPEFLKKTDYDLQYYRNCSF